MSAIDYLVILVYVAAIVLLSGSFFKQKQSLKDYLLGGRNIPWWAAALSGLAISSNSLLGAPGQAFKSDFTFMQYRLAIPVAIAVNVLIIIPIYYRMGLLSVYEYLERRFDLKTRLFASGLFVTLKCFFLGLVIYGSALVVAEMSGGNLTLIIILICTLIACFVSNLGTILVASSKLITFFGGTLVGVFLLGMLTRRANGWGAFLGALAAVIGVALLSGLTRVAFIWYGVFSATLAFGSGLLYSLVFRGDREK